MQVKAFTGGGFKLGSESQPSVAVGQPAAGGPSAAVGPRKFILKMWQVRGTGSEIGSGTNCLWQEVTKERSSIMVDQ